ncbi:type IV secretory system conjugative DNA transfer family protein [Rhodophyticola sp. CCM32]|uniref:type IV secretory system conjugative DNA transfer family protein n=1 Tax=Rhodophyticola sp. CCM32 TaxID=2916397 RepID=UPI0023674A87|nr:type IV secretory system conjugative DNA transfer family protein [Rhodophyticola sp. CCM32]
MSVSTRTRTPPFSIRLNDEERAALERQAGSMPLSSYVKSVVFADEAPRHRKRRAMPEADQRLLAEILARLGASRSASNLNQIAKHLNQGTLVIDEDLEADLKQAIVDVAWTRVAIMLGATAFGFGLGWFFFPEAAPVRAVIAVVVGGVAVLIAGFNHGLLGWSTAFVMAAVGFCWGVGFWAGQAIRALGDVPTTFGSARWADANHLHRNRLFDRGGILLGQAHNGRELARIFYKGDRHLLTVAPTCAWKGISHIIPNLLCYEGSVLVIDPKGENAIITAKARMDMGQEVHLVDPWNIAADRLEMTPARFNPLDWITLTDPDATENAMLLADALVQKDAKGEAFWPEEAKR